MADFETLGDDEFNPRKLVFLVIVALTTILVYSIFSEQFSSLSQLQKSSLTASMFPAIIVVSAFVGWTAYMALTKNMKIHTVTLWAVLLVTSVFFIRESITFFSTSGFPSSLAIGLVYTLIGSVASAAIALNLAIPRAKMPIDTVTSEEASENVLNASFKVRVLIAAALVVFTIFYVGGTGQAFIQAPSFNLAPFGILDSGLGNALVSGLVGGVLETAFFFAVLMPFIHGVVIRWIGSEKVATLAGILAISTIFVWFHTTVYAYSETALVSVGVFGLLNALLVLVVRDNYQNMAWHFANNFLIILFGITAFQVILG